jgi:hypothetical protein
MCCSAKDSNPELRNGFGKASEAGSCFSPWGHPPSASTEGGSCLAEGACVEGVEAP